MPATAERSMFLRKGRSMSNLTGEEVGVNQISNAFQAASKAIGAIPDHFKTVILSPIKPGTQVVKPALVSIIKMYD